MKKKLFLLFASWLSVQVLNIFSAGWKTNSLAVKAICHPMHIAAGQTKCDMHLAESRIIQ